jgi:uncharacterized protein with GYD domain
MALFVALVNWTGQGIKTNRDSIRRAEDYRGRSRSTAGSSASWSGRLAKTTSSR